MLSGEISSLGTRTANGMVAVVDKNVDRTKHPSQDTEQILQDTCIMRCSPSSYPDLHEGTGSLQGL